MGQSPSEPTGWRNWFVFATDWIRIRVTEKKDLLRIKIDISTKKVKEGGKKLFAHLRRLISKIKWWLL